MDRKTAPKPVLFTPLRRPHQWPLLEKLLHAKCAGYVDLALAERLMDLTGGSGEPIAALICHLSLSSRKGHVCVTIDHEGCIPPPEEIWSSEEHQESILPVIGADDMQKLSALINEGARLVSQPLAGCAPAVDAACPFPVCRDGNRFYLQRFWKLESDVVDSLRQLTNGWGSTLGIDTEAVRLNAEEFVKSGVLLPEQAEGVIAACSHPLTFITGGPGTGKTHTAGVLIRILWNALSKDRKKTFKVSLAAPTGKAAANLEASMKKSTSGLEGFPQAKGQTLHQLLGMGGRGASGAVNNISADLVIVDESSMIDIRLMGLLISAMKPGSHLVLLGDSHQLAPVEAGSLFADLVRHFSHARGGHSAVVELTKCLRSELREIVELSASIRKGAVDDVLSYFNPGRQSKAVVFHLCASDAAPNALQRELVKYALPLFPSPDGSLSDPAALLREFSRFRLLTPMRQGIFGVDNLNSAINRAFDQRCGHSTARAVPIMIVENSRSKDLFNGEVGLLVRQAGGMAADSYAIFPSRDDSLDVRKIPSLLLPRYEMAYCMTVHKSQGSEFDSVLLLLPEGAQMFGREGLYTGVTRAKQKLEVWSRPEIIESMVLRQALRHSGIAGRLTP